MSEDEVTKLLLDLKDDEDQQESLEDKSRSKRSPKFSSITKILKKGGKRPKREIELPENVAEIEVTPVSEEDLNNPEVEKILAKPLDITDMSEDEIAEALLKLSEESTEDEESTEEHNREKRSIHLHGAGSVLLGGKLLGKGLLKKGGKLLTPIFGKLGGDDKPKPIVKEQL